MSGHSLPVQLNTAPYETIDPGSGVAIAVTRWNQHIPIAIGAGAETNTLPNPTQAGQKLNLMAYVDLGGSRVITAASAINQTGNTVMTFADVDDRITLESFSAGSGAFKWRVAANDGVALS